MILTTAEKAATIASFVSPDQNKDKEFSCACISAFDVQGITEFRADNKCARCAGSGNPVKKLPAVLVVPLGS